MRAIDRHSDERVDDRERVRTGLDAAPGVLRDVGLIRRELGDERLGRHGPAGGDDTTRHFGIVAEHNPTLAHVRARDVDLHGVDGGIVEPSCELGVLLERKTRQVGEVPRLAIIERRQNFVDDRSRAGILQPDGVEHPRRRLPHPVRRMAERRFERRPLQTDRPGVSIREPLDPRILLCETHAARKQHERGVEPHSAELDRESLPITRIQGPCSTSCSINRKSPRTPATLYGSAPTPGARCISSSRWGSSSTSRVFGARSRLSRMDADPPARIARSVPRRPVAATDVRLLHPRRNALLRRLVPGRGRTAVRSRNAWTARCRTLAIPARAPAPHPDASRQPQPESVERSRRRLLRSVATVVVQRVGSPRGMNPAPLAAGSRRGCPVSLRRARRSPRGAVPFPPSSPRLPPRP